MLQHSNTNWAYVGPCVGQALPPPLPLVSMSLIRDTKRAGGGGVVAAGHLLTPVLRPNSPTVLIHQICQQHCHNWRITLLLREHPCQSTRARDVSPNNNGWGRQGVGEGWEGGNACVVYFWSTSSLRKNYKAVTLESHPHLTWAIAIIILVIRSSLKDWQSLKRVHTCEAQSRIKKIYLLKIFELLEFVEVYLSFTAGKMGKNDFFLSSF